jgi:hypothetical protein
MRMTPNKQLQLTPNNSALSIDGTALAASAMSQRTVSAVGRG